MAELSRNRLTIVYILLLLALSCLALAWGSAWGPKSGEMVTLCLVPVLVWISISDLRRREIPESANLLVAVIGAVLWAGSPEALLWNTLVAGAVTLVLGVVGGEVWKRTQREWLGLGDAKLIGAGTMVVGWDALWIMLFLASIGGICAALLGRARRVEQDVPFGPFLAYAILVTHLIAEPLR